MYCANSVVSTPPSGDLLLKKDRFGIRLSNVVFYISTDDAKSSEIESFLSLWGGCHIEGPVHTGPLQSIASIAKTYDKPASITNT